MKDSTMRAADDLIAALAERDGSDDSVVAADMVRSAGLDVAYVLAEAALIGAARAKRRAAALDTERRHQKAPTLEQQAEWQAADEEIVQRYHRRLEETIDAYRSELRMEWEAELLSSAFTLNDGTVVTWGAATIEQHEERAQMFKRNVMANAEGYARHQQAIDDLRASGAPSLSAMVGASSPTDTGQTFACEAVPEMRM